MLADWLTEAEISFVKGTSPGLYRMKLAGETGDHELVLIDHPAGVTISIYRFAEGLPPPERLRELLELSDQLTTFRIGASEDGHVCISGTWPSAHLTSDSLRYLLFELVAHVDTLGGEIRGIIGTSR